MTTPGRLISFVIPLVIAACNSGSDHKPIGSAVPGEDSNSISALTKPVPPEELIIPGRSIGMTELDETSESVHKRMGTPDAGDAAMGKSTAAWFVNHDTSGYVTQVYFSRGQEEDEVKRVKQIRITAPIFKLGDGSGTGTPFLKIAGLYNPKKVATFNDHGAFRILYDDVQSGIAFETDTDSIIRGLTVHEPGKEVTATYLPFFPDIKKQ